MPTGEPFLNPYTFIPAFPRGDLPSGFEDRAPRGQERLRAGWTGNIAVTLTVETPLLLLDSARATSLPNEHKAYPVRLRDGRPYLAATSVKGMLRSAFEAVTNSRFGVFTGHDAPLGFRRSAAFALGLTPVMIAPQGKLRAFQQAVIRMYDEFGNRLYPDDEGKNPQHRQPVRALVSAGKSGTTRVDDFTPTQSGRKLHPIKGQRPVRGVLYITGPTIDGKRNERLFYVHDGKEPEELELAVPWEKLAADWAALIRDYRMAHSEDKIHEREDTDNRKAAPGHRIGAGPGQLAWSPHLYDDAWTELSPGTLCYALRDHRTGKVTRLYPVLVPRDLYPVSPAQLLDKSLFPAARFDQLSPADRVFGWVAPEGTGVRPAAYKGRLRLDPVTCDEDAVTAVRRFDGDGLPLAILGGPKPQQGRFYLAESKQRPDRPVGDRTPKEELYRRDRGLRGRKAYWHHAGLDAEQHWNPPRGIDDPAQELLSGKRFREYLRPREPLDDKGTPTSDQRRYATSGQEQRDKQNRSITGWVRPGTTFRFAIDVRDLDDIELGALAWLLSLPEGHFHRLGLGRPLGFGSVRLDIDPNGTRLNSAADYTAYYRSLPGTLPETDGYKVLLSAREKFEQKVSGARSLAVIRDALLAVTAGDPKTPVHYPRTLGEKLSANVPAPPDPRGRNFEWFTQNERTGKDAPKTARRSLPTATDSANPLTVFPSPTEKNGRKGRNPRSSR